MGKYDKNIKITVDDKGALKQKTKDINKLNSAVDKNNKKSGNLDRNMKGNAKMSANASKNFSKQAQGMQGVLVPAYAEVAARVFALTAAYTALERAADYSILMKGQQAFAASTGKNMAQIARSIQKASGYMLDFQAASTSTALASTAGLTAKQIEKMTKGARAASVALGRDMADSMDRLTRGIVKAEPEILDELGVIIRLDKVYKDFAKSINKTTAELTEMEKLTARNTAIMGQLDSKFGSIADTIPANAFAQLSSSVLDLVRSGGALMSDFFSPLISALSDAKGLLTALMLLIGKNLISKVFPFFDGMGAKLSTFGKQMDGFKTKLQKLNESILKKSAGQTLIAVRDNDIKAASDQLKKMGVDGGTLGGKFFAKAIAKEGSVGAALLGKNIIANIRKSITAGRKDILQYGPVQPGTTANTAGMAGQTQADLNKLSATLDNLVSSVKQVAQATKGTMSVEAVSLFGKVGAAVAGAGASAAGAAQNFIEGATSAKQMRLEFGTLKTTTGIIKSMGIGTEKFAAAATKAGDKAGIMISQMSGMTKAGVLLNGVLAGMSRALGVVVGVMSAIMMVKWISQEILGLSKAFSTAHESVDSMNKSLEDTIRILKKAPKSAKHLGTSLSDSLSNKTYAANMTEGLFTSLDSATAELNVEALDNAWVGRWVDNIFDIFGAGLHSKLEDTISSALVGMSGTLDPKAFNDFLSEVDIEEGLVSQFDRAKDAHINTKAKLAIGGSVAAGASMAAVALAPVTLTVTAVAAILFAGKSAWDAFSASMVNSREEAAGVVDTLRQVNAGILSPELALEQLGDRLGNLNLTREELIQTYINISEASKAFATAAKEEEMAVKGLGQSIQGLLQARTAFSKGLVKGGELKDFAANFSNTLRDLNNNIIDSTLKFRQLQGQGLLVGSEVPAVLSKHWTTLTKEVKDLDLEIASVKMNIKDLAPEEINSKVLELESKRAKLSSDVYLQQGALYQSRIDNLKREIILEKDISDEKASRIATEQYLSKLMNGNVDEFYKKELARANKLEELALDKVHLQQFGNSSIERQAAVEQKVLRVQKEALVLRKDMAVLTEAEAANIADQIEVLDRKINNAGKTAVKLDAHFHNIAGTVQTVSDKIKAMRKDQGSLTGIDFANWRMDLINTEINAFNNSLDDTFASAQKVASVLSAINEGGAVNKDNLRKKFKNAFPDENSFKNIAKWVKMATTSQGKAITARMEVLNAEEDSRALTLENWGKHEDLLAYRERIAELERDYAEEGLKLEYEKLRLKETQAAISVMEADLVVAEWSALTSGFAEAMKGVSDGFAEGVSAFVSSKLLGRDESGDDKWYIALRKTLATGIATGVGDIAGKFAQEQVFGNKGFLSQGVGMFSKDLADTLFPKTKEEKLREALKELKDEAVKRAAILEKISINTGSTAANTSTTGTGTVGTGTISNSIANLSVLQDKYRELSKAGYQVKQTAEAINAAYQLLHPSKFEDSQVGGFSVSMGDRTVEIPPALAKFFDTMEIVAKGTESDAFEGHKEAGYSLEGFADVEKGKAAFYTAIAKDFDIPKDSILFKNPEYFLQAAGKFAVMSSGTTKNGTALNGMTDGITQGVFLDKKGGLNAVIHEAVHPLFDKFSTLAKDSDNFDKYSSKSAITLWEKTLAYVKSSEFASKTPVEKKRIVKTLDVGSYEESKRIEEYVVRAISQNSRLPEGSVPSDWLPEFMQQAMPAVIAEMDRLATPGALKAFDSEVAKASNSLSKMDNSAAAIAKLVTSGSKFLSREYAKIEAAIVKMFPRNNNGKYVQKGQEGYDLPYKDFAKQQGQKESAFRKGAQYRARETLKDAEKHEKGMYENSIQSDFLTHGRASSMQPDLFPQPDLPFGKPIPPAEPSIFSKLAPLFEKLNAALMFLMPNENIMDTKTETESLSDLPKGLSGALKVQEVDPKVPGGNGIPIPTTSITGNAATEQLSHDLRSSMASNLNSQIQNDNLNAKALMTNSLAMVGSNLMGGAINSMFGFATGGVAKGGFRAFASGGVVNQPTLGLVGEGKYNEAVVPLPDGKSIPVIGAGGNSGDNNITVNVTVDSNGTAKSDTQSGMDGDQAKQLGYMVSQAVQAELVEQQRHGGLLSSY